MAARGTIDVGGNLQLFVDEHLVETMRGAKLVMHSPQQRERVLRFNKKWEGSTCGYITVFEDEGVFRMYYRGSSHIPGTNKSPHQVICYAESKDGVRWTRPNLDLCEFKGSKRNNIVWDGFGSHNFAPFKDTSPACKPSQKYKAVAGAGKTGLVPYVSPDGIHWKQLRKKPIITEGKFDSQNVAFYDNVRGRYVDFHRHFKNRVRDIMTCYSDDFLNWTDPVWFDYGNAPAEHLYTNSTVPYFRAPEIFMSFPMRFVPGRKRVEEANDGVSDSVFMTSRDGVHWKRWAEAWIRPGPAERRWVCRNSMVSWGMLVTEPDDPALPKELSFYVGDGYYTSNAGVRRFTMRIDGFVSVNAPRKGGSMVTKPLIFSGRELVMNYATSAPGSVRVEIQDKSGKAIPGFELRNCPEIYGDSIEEAVQWKDGGDLSALSDKPVRLRFVLKDADLYSIRFRD